MTRKSSLARLSTSVLGSSSSSSMDLLFEKRVLFFITWTAIAGVIFWLASLATDYWVIVVAFNSEKFNASHSDSKSLASHHGIHLNDSEDRVFLWSHSGLWKRCDYFEADSNPVCQYHQDFLAENGGVGGDFLRAEVAVVVLVIVMIVVAASFSLYSLVHPRYMFKRLAGFLHIMTTITLLVVIEMVKSESQLSFHAFHEGILEHSRIYYGISYLLAWTVFIIHIIAGAAFLLFSKKRKYLKHDFNTTLK